MLSIAIFSYNKNQGLRELTLAAINSYKDQCDELIVVEDGGRYDSEIAELADTYILNRENEGFTRSVNQGIRMANNEYVACVSNDTYLVKGNIRDLCVGSTVTSPLVENQKHIRGFAGSFFVLPKIVTARIGLLDEGMKVFYSDTEYIDRLTRTGTEMKTIDSVVIHHHIAQTAHDTEIDTEKDKKHYYSLGFRTKL